MEWSGKGAPMELLNTGWQLLNGAAFVMGAFFSLLLFPVIGLLLAARKSFQDFCEELGEKFIPRELLEAAFQKVSPKWLSRTLLYFLDSFHQGALALVYKLITLPQLAAGSFLKTTLSVSSVLLFIGFQVVLTLLARNWVVASVYLALVAVTFLVSYLWARKKGKAIQSLVVHLLSEGQFQAGELLEMASEAGKAMTESLRTRPSEATVLD